MSYGVHVKGFNAYYTGAYGTGMEPLLSALRAEGIDVTHIPNHLAIREFPRDAEGLAAYDVVILSDIGADTLQLHPDVLEGGRRLADPTRAIAAHVANGGGLLMIGGYMSFSGYDGHARYHNTRLAEVLPVQMLGYDDRIEEPEGVVPMVVRPHEVLDGLPREWPFFLGYNRLRAKDASEVVLATDLDPFLVLGSHGLGRVAAFASDCSPHWGSDAFVGWPGYTRFWSQLVGWLAAGPVAVAAAGFPREATSVD
jgi:uncharacterized membrane protein